MKSTKNTKFVKDIHAADIDGPGNRPFAVQTENQRRFVRLEISAPMEMARVKDTSGQFWPEGQLQSINGMLLNISAGGVLVDLEQAVHEGDIVLMQFTLQETERLDNVLGLVKRAEHDGEGWLVGVQFISKAALTDFLSTAQIDLLPSSINTFEERVTEVMNRNLRRNSLANGPKRVR